MILYHPKALKPYLVRNPTNHFMAKMATKKAITHPTISRVMFCEVAHELSSPNMSSKSSKVAPAIVGTARKNENSAAFLRVNFCCIPPTIVDILRLIPGMTDRHWKQPMRKARLGVTSCSSTPFGPENCPGGRGG